MADVGLLLRESFFCGVENQGVLTCCPREGIIDKEQARFENNMAYCDNDKDEDKVAKKNRGVLTCCPKESIIDKEQARFENNMA